MRNHQRSSAGVPARRLSRRPAGPLLAALLSVSFFAAQPARADWRDDYRRGRQAFNLHYFEDAIPWLEAAAARRPRDGGKITVDNFSEPYLPYYYLGRAHLELGRDHCPQARSAMEKAISQGTLLEWSDEHRRLRRAFDEKCGACDDRCYRQAVDRIQEASARCARLSSLLEQECESYQSRRRTLTRRCASCRKLARKKKVGDRAEVREAADRALDAAAKLQELVWRCDDDDWQARQDLLAQIAKLEEEFRALVREDPAAARFVEHREAIESLIEASRGFRRDLPLADLIAHHRELVAKVRRLEEMGVAAAFADLATGVVKIEAFQGGETQTGTGVIVGLETEVARILTTTHVVEGASEVSVTFQTRPDRPLEAEVEHIQGDDRNGLVLLRVCGASLPRARSLALDQALPDPPQEIFMIGMPLSAANDWTLTRGEIAGRRDDKITADITFGKGNSGGPLVLAGGRVIGIVTQESVNFVLAIPARTVQFTLDGWGAEPCGKDSTAFFDYQRRKHHHEGIRPEEEISGFPLELISAVADLPVAKARWPDELKVRFYLQQKEQVFLTVRELDDRKHYWLDQVDPDQWSAGFDNEFSWPTAEVLAGLDSLTMADLGVVARIEDSGLVKRIAPAIFYHGDPPRKIRGYRFVFKSELSDAVRATLGVVGGAQTEIDQLKVTAGTSFSVYWDCTGAPEGNYRLKLKGKELKKTVEFYHQPEVSTGGPRS